MIACLKGIFLFRSTHQSSDSNSTIISVLSVFFCDLIVGLECWGRERTTLSPGEGGGCANFFCQSRKLVSPHSLIRQLLLSLDLLSGGEHAHRLGFFSSVQNNTCCLHRRHQFVGGRNANLLFSAQVGHRKRHVHPEQLCLFWDFCHLS